MDNLKEAKEILNYWYAIESLKPNPFPEIKEVTEQSYCKISGVVAENEILIEAIQKKKGDVKYEKYPFHSNEIEICVGKICIQEIIENLFEIIDEEMQEDVETEVCLFALRIDDKGKYIEHSLQISPFIWSTMNIIEEQRVNFQRLIPEASAKYIKKYEQLLKNESEKLDKKIWEVYHQIEKDLLQCLSENAKEVCALYVFNGYKEEKWRNKNNGTAEYSNLKQSYFLNDLYMVSENLHSDTKILDYILALNHNTNDNKINMLKDMEEIEKWYTSDKLPLGKWPSKYSLSFMQQVAVNIGVSEGAGEIFSVNGPPGTGKTTLLKEVIADTIVKRAIDIAYYDKPDDIFKWQKLEGIYDNNTKGYYVPNERFAKYEMLVVSSNNDAVQNLTLELPMANGVSSENTGINEFDINQTKEIWKIKEENGMSEVPEIYFSFAAKLLNSKHNRGDGCWGLISAPLGKKENISKFARCLNELGKAIREFEKNGNKALSYDEARKKFRQRYKKVCDMRKELHTYEQEEKSYQIADAKRDKLQAMYQEKKEKCQKKVGEIQSKKDGLNAAIYIVDAEIKSNVLALNALEQKKNNLLEEIKTLSKGTGILGTIFLKKERKENMMLANKKRAELEKLEEEKGKLYRFQVEYEKKRQEIEEFIVCYDKEIKELQEQCNRLLEEKNAEEMKYWRLRNTVLEKRRIYKKRNINIISAETREALSGKDQAKYEEVHCKEFLQYEAYNIERELLFYDALMLHKAVIFQSQAVKTNIVMLLKYWGEWQMTDRSRYQFSGVDRQKMAPALFHTLFLLVPVLSSTFASIETMFKDIRNEDEFGLMIVDEAGQAVPQMAVGAYMRFRRAIVVGDPKQIEPVVTLDKCLRVNLFAGEEVLEKYFDKSLSVQNVADVMNRYSGKISSDEQDEEEWIGCPLVVHRRCLDPMFSISNDISYGEIMVNRASYNVEEESFIYKKSLWIQMAGNERGGKNHFVEKQGAVVEALLRIHLNKNGELGELFIISPFRTVSNGIKEMLREEYPEQENWIYKHCGTVHTFQGKEAREVIYLLGCDNTSKGAVKWVNKNNINVAVTRAKQRIYFVGDKGLWENNRIMEQAMKYVDLMEAEQIVDIR